MKPGEALATTVTDGEWYDVVSETYEIASDSTYKHLACQENGVQEVLTRRKAVTRSDPSAPVHAESFSENGRTWYEKTVTQQPTGAWVQEETKHRSFKRAWDVEPFVSRARFSYTVWFRNLTNAEKELLVGQIQTYMNTLVEGWKDAGREPSSYSVDPNVRLGDNGLYDGSIECNAGWAAGGVQRTGPLSRLNVKYWTETPTSVTCTASGYGEYFYRLATQWHAETNYDESVDGKPPLLDMKTGHSWDPTTKAWSLTWSAEAPKAGLASWWWLLKNIAEGAEYGNGTGETLAAQRPNLAAYDENPNHDVNWS